MTCTSTRSETLKIPCSLCCMVGASLSLLWPALQESIGYSRCIRAAEQTTEAVNLTCKLLLQFIGFHHAFRSETYVANWWQYNTVATNATYNCSNNNYAGGIVFSMAALNAEIIM